MKDAWSYTGRTTACELHCGCYEQWCRGRLTITLNCPCNTCYAVAVDNGKHTSFSSFEKLSEARKFAGENRRCINRLFVPVSA